MQMFRNYDFTESVRAVTQRLERLMHRLQMFAGVSIFTLDAARFDPFEPRNLEEFQLPSSKTPGSSHLEDFRERRSSNSAKATVRGQGLSKNSNLEVRKSTEILVRFREIENFDNHLLVVSISPHQNSHGYHGKLVGRVAEG